LAGHKRHFPPIEVVMNVVRPGWCLAPLAGLLLGLAALAQRPPAKGKGGLPITGRAVRGLEPFDNMMTNYLVARGLPGAAVAVAKDGQLVYARGFGYADRDKKEPVQPTSLFRIASVSKPLTAVAILQLVQQGKLKLSDRPFDLLKIAPHLAKKKKIDPRLRRVTVLHCLHHTAGWDRDQSFDPMFRDDHIADALGKKLPVTTHDIIRFMWGRPLDFPPGQRSAYSNFGYCVLGRVIEKVSGQPYERYMQQHVLAPLGARHARLGRSLLQQRAAEEVRYYAPGKKKFGTAVVAPVGAQVLNGYGTWNHEVLDAHGGWISSAIDLVRFGSAWDRPGKNGVLSRASVERMFAPPAGMVGHKKGGKVKDVYYACGWLVRPYKKGARNTWHDGLLPGTSTLLVRRADGLCWAVLFNGSSAGKKEQPADGIDERMHDAADAVKVWPKHDLFSMYR
jgi:N-acyl-D-amino-acid deacylase